ncbi:MAG TPA: SpoIIE family protein phosphatase, partial [Terriglobia bacterium]|nr:SpoIIE family protein phosphatase [Terriglobia bacterium]
MSYPQFWRRAVWNYVLGTLVAIVPGFAFYSLAFDYTPEQLQTLCWLAIPAVATFLTVDLLILRWAVRPLCGVLVAETADRRPAPEAERQGIDRLLALPILVLPRIFGPHAIVATAALNLAVLWGNRYRGLGIPPAHFLIYWLLNLTVVPAGHVVFEYHATERLIQQPLADLLRRSPGRLRARGLVRMPLASRVFLFSALLGLAPPVIGGLIAFQRTKAAGLILPVGFFFQLLAVGGALALLWLLLLALVSREVGDQTRAITGALERIAAGDLNTEAPIRSISEFGQIALAINQMTAGLRERERLEQELSVARDIQQALLPKSFHRLRSFQVSGTNRPCLAVGGDYFDLTELADGSIAFVIADVSGKGLGAALVTSLLQGTFSNLASAPNRAGVLAHVNRFICSHAEMHRYATLYVCVLDPAGRLEFVNAGHPPPLLIREGSAEIPFTDACLPVGLFPDAEFKASTARLSPGDTLVLFTDGISEANDPEGELFGLERLRQVAAGQGNGTVEN